VQPVAQLLDALVIGIQDAFEGRTASIAVEQPIALLFLRRERVPLGKFDWVLP